MHSIIESCRHPMIPSYKFGHLCNFPRPYMEIQPKHNTYYHRLFQNLYVQTNKSPGRPPKIIDLPLCTRIPRFGQCRLFPQSSCPTTKQHANISFLICCMTETRPANCLHTTPTYSSSICLPRVNKRYMRAMESYICMHKIKGTDSY